MCTALNPARQHGIQFTHTIKVKAELWNKEEINISLMKRVVYFAQSSQYVVQYSQII